MPNKRVVISSNTKKKKVHKRNRLPVYHSIVCLGGLVSMFSRQKYKIISCLVYLVIGTPILSIQQQTHLLRFKIIDTTYWLNYVSYHLCIVENWAKNQLIKPISGSIIFCSAPHHVRRLGTVKIFYQVRMRKVIWSGV